MGWGGGTQIFDTVVEALRKAKVTDKQFKTVIVNLNEVLGWQDWDNLCESDYYDDPQIKDIFDLWEIEDE